MPCTDVLIGLLAAELQLYVLPHRQQAPPFGEGASVLTQGLRAAWLGPASPPKPLRPWAHLIPDQSPQTSPFLLLFCTRTGAFLIALTNLFPAFLDQLQVVQAWWGVTGKPDTVSLLQSYVRSSGPPSPLRAGPAIPGIYFICLSGPSFTLSGFLRGCLLLCLRWKSLEHCRVMREQR